MITILIIDFFEHSFVIRTQTLRNFCVYRIWSVINSVFINA
ncbi:Fe-Mn family superoxide dismutase [Gardnerella vaginalis]